MKLIFVGLVCFICSGCATYMARSEDGSRGSNGFLTWKSDTRGVYPATRMEAELIGYGALTSAHDLFSNPPLSIGLAALTVCMVVDFPFSLALDTLLLPYDYFKQENDE
jgi:uncharacterized protein YceK